jgi:hypothetical protein
MPPETSQAWREWGKNNVADEFWSIVNGTGDFSAAMAAWTKLHPDTLPFTIGKSEVPSGAVVDSNKAVGDFINSNKGFFDKYASAAPYWLSGIEGSDDWETRDLLSRMGIREAKTFESFYSDLKIGPALNTYYDYRDQHEAWQKQAEATGVAPEVRDQEAQQYELWSQMYRAQNPMMNDYILAGGVRGQERTNTINEMELALLDPAVPKTASTNAINGLLSAYRAHTGWVAQQVGTTDAVLQAKQDEQTRYEAYMSNLAGQDPAAKMVWNMLLRYAS